MRRFRENEMVMLSAVSSLGCTGPIGLNHGMSTIGSDGTKAMGTTVDSHAILIEDLIWKGGAKKQIVLLLAASFLRIGALLPQDVCADGSRGAVRTTPWLWCNGGHSCGTMMPAYNIR